MKIRSFEFNLRELAGATGDFGTLLPLAVGYIAVCGLNPAGFLVMMGLANIVTGIVYRIPVPIEPMKVIAVMAIAQHWAPSMVYAAGFAMGIVWLIFSGTGIIGLIARMTPSAVIRGVQVALGVLLCLQAWSMMTTSWLMGLAAFIIVLVLRYNRYAPAGLVLIVLGVAVIICRGELPGSLSVQLTLPYLTGFQLREVWQGLVRAGFAQVPLTATNAIIATAALIKSYWPDKAISEKKLSLNTGVMNLINPFLGGMPQCHGAGGLAGQYYFGARTGGANIMEGLFEIFLGLFLASSIAELFSVFPLAIVGVMMFLVGVELIKFTKDIYLNKDLITFLTTVIAAIFANMAAGFVCGLCVHHCLRRISTRRTAKKA